MDTLQIILDQRKVEFERTATGRKLAAYAAGIAAIEASGIVRNARQAGEKAPVFTLKNGIGKSVALADYLRKGPVILTWYRGGWCPYCNLTLHRLQEELPRFKAMGANLLALTPELPDKSISTSEKHRLQFEVLSDTSNHVARSYGIVFEVIPEVMAYYNENFDMHACNGDTSDELPLAATYLIGTDGMIKYAFLDADYRKRAEPADILEALKKLI